jgi:HEPN domain-containing protein
MSKISEEWLRQAKYDMDTAEYMFRGRRYFYTVFMCHLSIEKALKGQYQKVLGKIPPKTHNLIYLIEKAGLELPEDLYEVVFTLNRVSIPTRYPNDLKRIVKEYNREKTKTIVTKSKEVLKWLKRRF